MKARKHRPIPRFKPSLLGEAFVRYAVQAVRHGEGGETRRLASGIGIEAEARLIFRAACDEIRQEPGYASTSIVLQRHTTEAIAYQPPASRDVVIAAERKVDDLPDFPAAKRLAELFLGDVARRNAQRTKWAMLGHMLRSRRARLYGTAKPAEPSKIQGKPAGPIIVDELEPETTKRVSRHDAMTGLFQVAAGHQGGHSHYGQILASTLKTEFPITMHALAIRALEEGFNPREVWAWWGDAPADMEAALANYAARENDQHTD